MKNKKYWPSSNDPVWLEEGYRINESVFCETFISTHKIVFCNGFFFTEDGRVTEAQEEKQKALGVPGGNKPRERSEKVERCQAPAGV